MIDELKPCPTCGQRPYTYIGKDMKTVLARDLEDERDRLREALVEIRYLADLMATGTTSRLGQMGRTIDAALEESK